MEKEMHGVRVLDEARDGLNKYQRALLEDVEPARRRAYIYLRGSVASRKNWKWENAAEELFREDGWTLNIENGYCMEVRKNGAYFFLHPNVFSGYVAKESQLSSLILTLKEREFRVESASLLDPLYVLTSETVNKIYQERREIIDDLILEAVRKYKSREAAFEAHKVLRLPTTDNFDRCYSTGDFEHILVENELDCLIRLGRIKERDGALSAASSRAASR